MSAAPLLTVRGICKAYGALHVLGDVGFEVLGGETLGLIGPNGAGKTTLFNILTGFVRPDSGNLTYLGADLTRLSREQRVRQGLARSFQRSMTFAQLSVRQNVALAVRMRQGSAYRWWPSAAVVRAADERADWLIGSTALAGRADHQVERLSHGEQRMVDVLISLALEPRLLLLDEPTAGLAREEAQGLLDLFRQHAESTSMVLIAHDLDLVFGICDRIAVLDLGKLIAVDTPQAIRAHQGVCSAYLGKLVEAKPCC